jgi:hypothetical protein
MKRLAGGPPDRGQAVHLQEKTEMRKLALAAAVVLSVLVPLATLEGASAPSPWVATWVLDAAHSKIAPNRPTGVSLRFLQADAAMIKYALSFTTAQGQSLTSNYAGKPDGKPHPVTINGQEVGQVAYSWKSPRVLRGEVSAQNGSKEELELTIAADGKSISEIRRMKAPTESEETLIFRRK